MSSINLDRVTQFQNASDQTVRAQPFPDEAMASTFKRPAEIAQEPQQQRQPQQGRDGRGQFGRGDPSDGSGPMAPNQRMSGS